MNDHDLATKRPWSVHDAVTVGELCDFDGLAIYQDEDLKISEDGDECPSAICFMNPNWGEAEYTAKFIVAAVEAYDKNKDLSSLLIAAQEENSRLREALKQAREWFQQYADGHNAKGDTDKAQRNQDRADFCARAANVEGREG